jgi:hypothetical protein
MRPGSKWPALGRGPPLRPFDPFAARVRTHVSLDSPRPFIQGRTMADETTVDIAYTHAKENLAGQA